MRLHSTSDNKVTADFRTAVKQGLAPDGGLYMPDSLPVLPDTFWVDAGKKDIASVAQHVFDTLLKDDFSDAERKEIVDRAFTFDAPVVSLDDTFHILELFHGPTLAFKDFGARTMAAILSVIAEKEGEKLTIVTATSGDTGAAVAHGFHKTPGVEVFVLYPRGQVSPLQEKQFTTLGDNIIALEVNGTFDDCQRLVKACFSDDQIRAQKQLSTANSINIARLLPQMIYYMHAVSVLIAEKGSGNPIVCSVPSGNFGNLTAGLMAHRMGLPVDRFVAATNCNHVVPDYLEEGEFIPKPSMRTLSNAMDVGNPSNFDRMQSLYNHDHEAMSRDIKGAWFDDFQTQSAIVDIWVKHGYLMDPHTAVGYLGCREYLQEGETGLVLATAHPAKFPESIEKFVPGALETPEQLKRLADRDKKSIPVSAGIESVRDAILRVV
ncbi:threonine synthase [Natronogracilivirga saccharolytica]|uniref:Threonine synthase n=1 Tax=Natronogracilivirga saccharolytica TaxID=2812953 RepID=A0A8J7RJZ8_9BACT|nr:threonine synthase [Natronogracilivirga saccharolytica]MBP3193135.1 threonine synthase [Natronogracilivirga saccharolytica]